MHETRREFVLDRQSDGDRIDPPVPANPCRITRTVNRRKWWPCRWKRREANAYSPVEGLAQWKHARRQGVPSARTNDLATAPVTTAQTLGKAKPDFPTMETSSYPCAVRTPPQTDLRSNHDAEGSSGRPRFFWSTSEDFGTHSAWRFCPTRT
jgi:hypothetical protein